MQKPGQNYPVNLFQIRSLIINKHEVMINSSHRLKLTKLKGKNQSNDDMKRLLIITDLFPDKYLPFSEVFVKQQADELAKYYEVRVISTRLKRRRALEKVQFEQYPVTYIYIPYIRYVYFSLIFTYRYYAIPEICKEINDWGPDLIHVHDFKHVPELFMLHYCLKRYRIPRYLTVHNIRTHPSMIKSTCFNWFYRYCLGRSYIGWNHIFTVNDRLKKTLSVSAKQTAITTIGNAIGPVPKIDPGQLDTYKSKLDRNSFKIISVGNLKKEKGFDILIEAVSRLIASNHDIQLFIVGNGSERDRLWSQIKSLGVEKSIILTGDLSNELVRNLYSLFDAFVLASYSETFGVVYIEAMYSGLPVIGIRGQGIDGVVIDGENGYLARPQDADDLTVKIEYIINHREAARTVAEKGQSLVQSKFRIEQLIGKVIDIYEQ